MFTSCASVLNTFLFTTPPCFHLFRDLLFHFPSLDPLIQKTPPPPPPRSSYPVPSHIDRSDGPTGRYFLPLLCPPLVSFVSPMVSLDLKLKQHTGRRIAGVEAMID